MKLKVFLIIINLAIYGYIAFMLKPFIPSLANAACEVQTDSTKTRANGLISAVSKAANKFKTATGVCVISPEADTGTTDTYTSLKNTYFKSGKAYDGKVTYTVVAGGSSIGSISNLGAYAVNIQGDLTVNGNFAASGQPLVLFIDGNLNFTNNYTYGGATTGTVFIVNGDVNIAQNVTQLLGVIISQGTIYTAGAGCTKSNIQASPLGVNGSLINIGSGKTVFCRTQGDDNTNSSENIVFRAKYLAIVADILSVDESTRVEDRYIGN